MGAFATHIALTALSFLGLGDTIHVPGDQPTIQAGIQTALDGDTVLVAPGTYMENIDFLGKTILVKGDEGPEKTVIDGGKTGSVVTFAHGEGAQSILAGFTVSNGSGTVVTVGLYSYLLGAGIYCVGSSPTIIDNRIAGNEIPDTGWAYGYSGGGIYCADSACPLVEDNVFEQNRANEGGAIYCVAQASPVIRGNTITDNRVMDYHSPSGLLMTGGGAAISCHGMVSQPESDLLIEDNVIRFNLADRGAGAIRLHQRPKGVIRRNWIQYNGKRSIACFVLHSVLIEENRITDTLEGHAIYCWNAWPAVKILNNEIARSQSGSGIWLEESQGTISGNRITENSNSYGAGLHVDGGGKIASNVIAFNTATGTEKGGGGIFLTYGSNCKIVNNTVVGNVAAVDGGGISSPKAQPTIVNSIVWGNSAPGGVQIHGDDCVVEYCDVMGGHPGTGNIDADPLFVNLAGGDLHLTFLSPCRGSGDDSAVIGTADFEGDPRIAYGTVDMGADEFHTHLYFTGDAAPGGSLELKFIDLPGASPVGFWIAFNALETSVPGAYGDWWLAPPLTGPFFPGSIPANGVRIHPGALPPSPAGPYTLLLQAGMGTPLKLTNLCEMDVQ